MGQKRRRSQVHFGLYVLTWKRRDHLKQQEATDSGTIEHQGQVSRSGCHDMRSHLSQGLQVEVSDPTTIYYDNLINIQLAQNLVFHARTKHIEVHCYFVHEYVLSSEVELVYVLTDRQAVDIFTIPFGLEKFQQFSGALGLQELDIPSQMKSSISG